MEVDEFGLWVKVGAASACVFVVVWFYIVCVIKMGSDDGKEGLSVVK